MVVGDFDVDRNYNHFILVYKLNWADVRLSVHVFPAQNREKIAWNYFLGSTLG